MFWEIPPKSQRLGKFDQMSQNGISQTRPKGKLWEMLWEVFGKSFVITVYRYSDNLLAWHPKAVHWSESNPGKALKTKKTVHITCDGCWPLATGSRQLADGLI
jgi:hypothetical protein